MSNVPRLITVDRLHCILEPHAWDFAALRAEDIQSHWREKKRANPSLYDGRVLLARRVAQSGDAEGDRTLSIEFFETGFSNFLAWRDFGFPDAGVYNCFAMAALRSKDGAYLLGEMGPGHSSAGAIYFPGGTPDLLDVRGDFVDLEGSAARELFGGNRTIAAGRRARAKLDDRLRSPLRGLSEDDLFARIGRGPARPHASSSDAGR